MPLRDDILAPIEGPNPCGEDLSYDAVYDQIQEARREEDELPQGEWERPIKTADWAEVETLASEALAKRSKDLTLAAWLTEARLHRAGFGGLAEGLHLLRTLLEQFWEHLYPEMEEGDAELRAAPLNWVGHQLVVPVLSAPLTRSGIDHYAYEASRRVPSEEEAQADSDKAQQREEAIAEGTPTPEAVESAFNDTPKAWYKELVAGLEASLSELEALDQVGREKFGEADAPSYLKLREALQTVHRVARGFLDRKLELEPDPVEAPPVQAPSPAPGAEAVATSAPGPPAAISPEPVNPEDAAARVAAAARYLRRSDPCNPASYLMLRGLRWGELRVKGRDLDPRLLAAPATPVRSHLKGLLLDEKWEQLLDAGEEVMATPEGRGWLDLQRYILTACDNLGSEYEHVGAAIRGALSALLRDLPQLPQMTLMDDTPTANAETQAWLARELGEIGAAETEEAESPARPAAARKGRLRRSAIEQARARVRQGQPEKAIELLMEEAEEESSARGQFLLRVEAASIMVESGLCSVALPILEQLVEQIDRHNLEGWEAGDLVAQPLGLLCRCLGDENPQRRDELYERVCRLDPLQAMAFRTGSADDRSHLAEDGSAVDPGPVDRPESEE